MKKQLLTNKRHELWMIIFFEECAQFTFGDPEIYKAQNFDNIIIT